MIRRYLTFSIVCLALALFSMSGSAVSVAFPVITSDFNTSLVLAGWVLNASLLASTIVMPLAGKITDILGGKTTFMLCTLFFTVGSMLCAVAPNLDLLIGSRVIQGIGGGGFLPCAAGIVSDEFPEARQRYIGLFSTVFPIGLLIGPNLGGWMVETFGWRSIFWFNVPLGLAVLALAQWLLRANKSQHTGSNIDFIGAGLLLGSLLAMMLGLTEIGNSDSGIPWVVVGALFALGIGLMFAFVRQERRAREPVVDLEILAKRPFLAANIYNIIYGMAALGIFSLVPLYAVSVYRMSVFESGFILTPRSVGTIIASIVTSVSLMKWGYRRPILVGTVTMALSLFLLSFQSQGVNIMGINLGATALLMAIMGLSGIGHGISTPASNNACIELMPEKVATITGLRGMFRQLGSIIGISVSTILLHSLDNVQHAFYIIMFGSALILLISIPTIFLMPSSPNTCTPRPSDKNGNS
jgi:EmrB/QacA subfamily drug resistance transporter